MWLFGVRESRSWFKVRAIALVLTLVISILILSALCIVLVSGSFVDWLGQELRLASAMIVVWKALQWPTALLFVIFSYALIYTFGPNLPRIRWHWITPGSVFGAILWLVASAGFRIYLRFVNNYTRDFWVPRGVGHSDGLAVRYRAGVSDRRRNQRQH